MSILLIFDKWWHDDTMIISFNFLVSRNLSDSGCHAESSNLSTRRILWRSKLVRTREMATRQSTECGQNDQRKVRASVPSVALWTRATIVHRQTIRGAKHAGPFTSRTWFILYYYCNHSNTRYYVKRRCLQMCRELRFTWRGKKESLGVVSSLINKPDGAIQLNFKDLHA